MDYPFLKLVGTSTLVVLALLLGSTYYYYSPLHPKITKAIAVIQPTKGNTAAGVVAFIQQDNGLHVMVNITGLTQGKHGLHIHEFGDCSSDDGASAGDHYNPTLKQHGAPQNTNRHSGDLGNIIADEQGNATYDYIDQQATLNGPYSIIGRTVIVHAQEDDFTTQPSGNAGARLGCGVIGIAKK